MVEYGTQHVCNNSNIPPEDVFFTFLNMMGSFTPFK